LTKLQIHTDGRGPLWISLHVCTDTGREALRLIAPAAPDAVVLDLSLPDVDGKSGFAGGARLFESSDHRLARVRPLGEKKPVA
jgi:DNA-binding NarL/FixJ family response regulator